jgi:hypothetical protein
MLANIVGLPLVDVPSPPPALFLGIWVAAADVPPIWLCALLGMQHFLTFLGSTVAIPSLLVPAMGGTREGTLM